MIDRLVAVCAGVLVAVIALVVAVRLLESIAAALVIIAAVIGGGIMLTVATRLAMWLRRSNRW